MAVCIAPPDTLLVSRPLCLRVVPGRQDQAQVWILRGLKSELLHLGVKVGDHVLDGSLETPGASESGFFGKTHHRRLALVVGKSARAKQQLPAANIKDRGFHRGQDVVLGTFEHVSIDPCPVKEGPTRRAGVLHLVEGHQCNDVELEQRDQLVQVREPSAWRQIDGRDRDDLAHEWVSRKMRR